MHLKTYLRKEISASLMNLQKKVTKHEEALAGVNDLNTRKANYIVYLNTHWEDGTKSSTTKFNGSLEGAIQKAEEEFKSINKCSDVYADYSVDIQIGNDNYQIPEEYWDKFKNS